MPLSCIRESISDCAMSRGTSNTPEMRVLTVADIVQISKQFGTSGKQVELCALENGIWPERYVRNSNLLSVSDQIILLHSTVTVAGLGGVGGAVAEVLARTGIGTLNLIDHGVFEDNSLNRQLFSNEKVLGQFKTKAAMDRIRSINSSIEVNPYTVSIDETNVESLLRHTDVVVDCLDDIYAGAIVGEMARQIRRPLVYGAIAGISGQVSTLFPEDSGLRLIYGSDAGTKPGCTGDSLGNLPQAAMLVASIQCLEVIKILLKKGSVLKNKLLMIDLSSNLFEVISLLPAMPQPCF